MQIREVEIKTGLTKKAIRYYEENGLIITDKKCNGYKEYDDVAFEKLLKIKQLRLLDFTIPEIKSYFADGDAREIVSKKLREHEQRLQQTYAIKRMLEEMLAGKSIDNMYVEQKLLQERKKQYLYIRNKNFAYGIINLFLIVIIYGYFILNWNSTKVFGIEASGIPVLFFFVTLFFLLFYSIVKKEKRKRMGIIVLERKLDEIIISLIIAICTYFESAYMLRDGFYYSKLYFKEWDGDWYQVIGNAAMGICMGMIGVALVITSFVDSNKKSAEFI